MYGRENPYYSDPGPNYSDPGPSYSDVDYAQKAQPQYFQLEGQPESQNNPYVYDTQDGLPESKRSPYAVVGRELSIIFASLFAEKWNRQLLYTSQQSEGNGMLRVQVKRINLK